MTRPEDAQAEHQFDQWLTTARAALDTALDVVLDLNAGLADAALPGRHTALMYALDDVLNLNAGLHHVLPNRHADLPPYLTQTALAEFADHVTTLPLHERLTARTWLPQQELTNLQLVARRAVNRDPAAEPDRDHALVGALNRALVGALDPAHERADALALDRDPDRIFARVLARDLARARARDLASNPDRELERDLIGARDLARALERDLSASPNRIRIRALALVLDLAVALAVDRYRLTRPRLASNRRKFVHDLLRAIDRLEIAIANVTNADLTLIDLNGIPLEGLRWSRQTRWPPGWQDTIERNSVEIKPGLYKIRSGGVTFHQTIDTPV